MRIKPSVEEYREAHRVVGDAISSASQILPFKEEIEIEIRWTERQFVKDNLDGASGLAHYPNMIELKFNTEPSLWKKSLRTSAAHEYAHIWDYSEREGKWNKQWEYILGEALSQILAEKVVPDYNPEWRKKYSRADIGDYWEKIKEEELDKDLDEMGKWNPLFINENGEGEFPNWIGYSLAYRLGKRILKNKDLSEISATTKTELLTEGDKIFLGKEYNSS